MLIEVRNTGPRPRGFYDERHRAVTVVPGEVKRVNVHNVTYSLLNSSEELTVTVLDKIEAPKVPPAELPKSNGHAKPPPLYVRDVEEIKRLQDKARSLRIEFDGRWGERRLKREIEKRQADGVHVSDGE